MERKNKKRISAFQMQCTEEEQTETSGDKNRKGNKSRRSTSQNRKKSAQNDDRKQSSNPSRHCKDDRLKSISNNDCAIGKAQSDGVDSAKKRKSPLTLPVDDIGAVDEKKTSGKKRKVSARNTRSSERTRREIESNQTASLSVGACGEMALDKTPMQTEDVPAEIQTVDINELKIDVKQVKSKNKKSKNGDINSPTESIAMPGKRNTKESSRVRKGKRSVSSSNCNENVVKCVENQKSMKNTAAELNTSGEEISFVNTTSENDEDGETDISIYGTTELPSGEASASSDNDAETSGFDLESMSTSYHDGYISVKTDDGIVVVLCHPAEYVLKGKASIECLSGTASILGYDLVSGRSSVDVFSPDSTSLLTLTTKVGNTDVGSAIKIISKSLTSRKYCRDVEEMVREMKSVVVVKCRKLEARFCEYIRDVVPYTELFRWQPRGETVDKKFRAMGLSLHLPDNSVCPYIRVSSELQEALDTWSSAIGRENRDPAVMLVCGGKDSGKSTTSRLLINTSLSRLESVYYLECDVGQTEFTPPGIVSLMKVTTPVLGPPFCHQRVPICSYVLGGLSPADDPNRYMKCVHLCVQRYQQLETTTPLIVNTMGWMRGLGLKLLVDTVRLMSPSHVIQLQSDKRSQYGEPLTETFYQQTSWTDVSRAYGEKHEDFSIDRERRSPQIVILSAPSATGCPTKLRPVDHRDLSVLSHLSGNLDPGLTLTSMTPYCISWADVALYASDIHMSQVWNALNGCLVALCLANIKQAELLTADGPLYFRRLPSCRWIGYGIVRGVDMDRKVVVVATTLDVDSLSCVNTLVKGAVTLPEHLLGEQTCGDVPYVTDAVSGVGSGALKPRKRMPRNVHQT